MIINLDEYKRFKKATRIQKELNTVLFIINGALRLFEPYSKYIPVSEIITTLDRSKVIIEIHLMKIKKIIENKHE